jgi:enoyl-CoA hydratase/carnithine racemase
MSSLSRPLAAAGSESREPGRLRSIAATGRLISAQRGLELGFINEVTSPGDLMDVAVANS